MGKLKKIPILKLTLMHQKKYHHAPTKLDIFKHFTHYVLWSNELYSSSIQLINVLKQLYNESIAATSTWSTKKIL